MALSGSIQGSIVSGHYILRVDWSAVQNIEANTSTITADMYLINDWALQIGSRTGNSITIDGTTYPISSNAISTIGTHYIGRATKVITHNADGTRSFNLSAYFDFRATIQSTYYASISASGSGTLDTIPRASLPTVSPSPVELGGALTIQTHRASTEFTHTLKYTFGNLSGTIVTNLATDYVWTVPLSLANAIPNATSGSGVITCETYQGTTLIGSKTVPFTVTVPASVVPTISAVNISEAVAGLAAQFLAYVQSKSKLNVATTASGAYSSTISEIKVTIESKNYFGASITSDVIAGSGTINVVVLVTDSRGRTATTTVNVTVVAYASPQIASMSTYRVNGSGTPSDDGTSIAIPMNFTIANVGDKNTKTWTLEYRIVGAATWTPLSSGSVYTYNATYTNLTGLFDGNNAYEIRLTITDYFTSVTRIVSISTAFALININASGKGIALGKVSAGDNFEVALDANFTGNLLWGGMALVKRVDFVVTDFNAIDPTTLELGRIYTFYTNFQAANRPLAANYYNGTIQVHALAQKHATLIMSGSGEGATYTRYFNGTSWGSWYRLFSGANDGAGSGLDADLLDGLQLLGSGGILDSGSNANGNYIKFADGTMICWMAITVTNQAINNAYGSLFQGSRTWTFPVAFYARPTVTCTEFTYDTGASWGAVVGPSTTTSAQLRGIDAVSRSGGLECKISAMAIGRWKA